MINFVGLNHFHIPVIYLQKNIFLLDTHTLLFLIFYLFVILIIWNYTFLMWVSYSQYVTESSLFFNFHYYFSVFVLCTLLFSYRLSVFSLTFCEFEFLISLPCLTATDGIIFLPLYSFICFCFFFWFFFVYNLVAYRKASAKFLDFSLHRLRRVQDLLLLVPAHSTVLLLVIWIAACFILVHLTLNQKNLRALCFTYNWLLTGFVRRQKTRYE